MLRTIRSLLHSISGKVFWFSSSYLPPAHAARVLVENGLLRFYRWELGRDPGLADVYSKIGSLLANQGQPGPAVAHYASALEAGHPDAAKVHYFMGRQKARQGDVPGAVECFRQFVRIAAPAKGVRADDADAWSRLDELPDFDPGQFHGYLYLANKCIEGGLDAPAIEFLNASVTLEPLVHGARVALAEMLYASGRRKESLGVVRSGHYFHLRQSHPRLRIRGLRSKRAARPDFLILGKLKCGTTSLYSWLTRHPCIVPALTKELHFFDDRYDRGLDWYLAQFPPIGNRPELITGEASADYIDSQLVAERIRRDFPRTRFIVLLRDPVERAISHYRMNMRLGLEAGDMKTALLKGVDPASGSAPPNQYVERSIYVRMLKVWLEMFPREQFLILASEQLFAAPGAVTNRVFEFLGQAPFTGDDYRARNQGPDAAVDPALKDRLREYFLPHNQALEQFLGMRFGWDD